MRFRRPQCAIAIAVVSVSLSVVPTAVPASAASGKGSDPTSAFCRLEKATLATNSPT